MALQSALSRLRTGANCQSLPPTERRLNSHVVSAKPAAVAATSFFSLEDTEKDAFNFSDDDFQIEGSSISFMCKPASEIQDGEDTSRSPVQENHLDARTNSCQNRMEIITQESHRLTIPDVSNPSDVISAGINPTVTVPHSPSSSSLEKLKSFKFVKTPNLKGGKRKPESGNIVPPAKRRTVHDDVGNYTERDPLCSQSVGGPSQPSQSSVAHLHQGAGEVQNSLPGNLPTHSKRSLSPNDNISLQNKTDFDLDAFLSDSEENRHSAIVSQPTTSSLAFKTPSCAPRRTAPLPSKRADIPSHVPSTPSTPLHPCSVAATSCGVTNSSLFRTPSREALTTPSVGFRAPSMSNPRHSTVETPSTSSTASSSAQSKVFATPKSGQTLQGMATPSAMTTPIFRTPTNAQRPLRRKFPGPAGLLPTLGPGQSMEGIVIPPSTPIPASTPRVQRIPPPTPSLGFGGSSQVNAGLEPDEFSQGPWLEMLQDLDMNDAQSSALLQHSVSSAIKQASCRQLRGGKVVHLRVMLKNIVPAGKNASAILKDPTGEVLCTIHTKVLDDHQKELQPGAVLVLRQVSVFSPTPRKHYLNITPDNIVRIYTPNSDNGARQPLILSQVEKCPTEHDALHLPAMSKGARTGVEDDESGDRLGSVLKSCRRTLTTFAQSSQMGQQCVTSQRSQNARTVSENQDDSRTPQNSWNDSGDSFEGWDDLDDAGMQPVQTQTSDADYSESVIGNAHKETGFFGNLCEAVKKRLGLTWDGNETPSRYEFDSLFSDMADSNLGF